MRATTLVRLGWDSRTGSRDLGQEGGDVLGGLALAGAGVVARVGGVDPEQVAADVDDLVLRGHLVLCFSALSLSSHSGEALGAARPGVLRLERATGPGRGRRLAQDWAR